jgi:Fe2+ or Zn2+ uptake regulation protein
MNGTNRLTGPRQRVLAAIRGARGRHLDAFEVAAAVNRSAPAVHIATVYRALAYLVRQGLVKRSSLNQNHAHYETGRNDGVHLVCSICGGVREIGGRQSKKLLTGLESSLKNRFTVNTWQVELTGTCSRCARPNGRPSAGKHA